MNKLPKEQTRFRDIDTNLCLFFIYFFAAIANVYRNQGNEAFKKGDFLNAVRFYTEGIKVECNDKELKTKLYNNRAISHFKLGKKHKYTVF